MQITLDSNTIKDFLRDYGALRRDLQKYSDLINIEPKVFEIENSQFKDLQTVASSSGLLVYDNGEIFSILSFKHRGQWYSSDPRSRKLDAMHSMFRNLSLAYRINGSLTINDSEFNTLRDIRETDITYTLGNLEYHTDLIRNFDIKDYVA